MTYSGFPGEKVFCVSFYWANLSLSLGIYPGLMIWVVV